MINKEKLFNTWHTLHSFVHDTRLHHFANGFPKTYFFAVCLAALLGYGFLLMFPLLVIVAVTQLWGVAQTVPFTVDSLSQGLVWFAVLIFCTAICHHIFTVKFEPPKGIGLPAAKTPALFELINDNKGTSFWSRLFWPKFNNVLLSEQFVLEIHKTPVTGIPLWSKNTLVIGFPLMQTMPQHYFDCTLVRKIVQYSKGRNLVTNFLYQLRDIWFLYPQAFSQRKLLGEQVIVWFFRWYAPFYSKLSLYLAQQEELAADRLALREINDIDLFKSIESQAIAQNFFHKIYLPLLHDFIRNKGANTAQLNPYTTLPNVYRKAATEERCKQWIEGFQKSALNTRSPSPTLSQRMGNIGHSRIRLPQLGGTSAAEHYFAAHYPMAAQLLDNVWRNKTHRQLKRRRNSASHTTPGLHIKAAVS